MPDRNLSGTLLMLTLLMFVALDLLRAEPIDPYQAPYPTALGSGQAPSGAHCTDVSSVLD